MSQSNHQIIYWARLNHAQWNIYMAVTIKGLCFVGSQNERFEELEKWAKKRLPNYVLVEDAGSVHPYAVELIGFLQGVHKEFSLPIDLHGTPFQMSVWEAVLEIPFGQTVSYSDIALRIQKPKSVRAVGTAIGANPLLINVPCHRVIGKSGLLTGYRGGLEMKEQLLALENDRLV